MSENYVVEALRILPEQDVTSTYGARVTELLLAQPLNPLVKLKFKVSERTRPAAPEFLLSDK